MENFTCDQCANCTKEAAMMGRHCVVYEVMPQMMASNCPDKNPKIQAAPAATTGSTASTGPTGEYIHLHKTDPKITRSGV